MARRWHRPSALAWLLVAAGLVVFSTLGLWQWHRANEKERLLNAFATASSVPAEPFRNVADVPTDAHYPHVSVRGRFERERSYLLDEQVRGGRVGLRAIAIFTPNDDTRRLLVDRGWVAWPARSALPALSPLPQGEVELTGLYAPPPGGGLRIGGEVAGGAWPKLVLQIEPSRVAADLGVAVYPRLLLLDPDPASGFVREWAPTVLPPARHRGYAFQWFSFAVAAAAIFVVRHWRPQTETDS